MYNMYYRAGVYEIYSGSTEVNYYKGGFGEGVLGWGREE